jgi:hypothetical protein
MSLAPDISTPSLEGVSHEISPDQVNHPLVQQGYAYWKAKRGGRAFPARGDISPAEIKALLPNIILIKVLDGGADYQYRIVGQASVRAHGFNPSNWRVDDLDRAAPGYSAVVRRVFDRVVRGVPYASRGVLAHIDRAYRSFESLYLPLGPDAQTVDHVLIVVGYSGGDVAS